MSGVTDHADGTYTATLAAGSTAGLAIVSGTLNGVAITDTAGVLFRALPDPTTTTVTADSAAIDADGASTTLITVRVLDGNGVPVGASVGPVMLATTLGNVTTPTTDHGDGTYTATLTAGTTAGLAIVSGTLNGVAITDTAGVMFRALPDPTTTTITADSAAIDADGMSTTLITVRVLDGSGNPRGVSAGPVTLASTLGNVTTPAADHGDGTYTATLTAGTTAGLAIVSGTLNGVAITDTAGVIFRALPDPTTTTITADSSAIDANGTSSTLITVRVLDGSGNPRGASAGPVILATTLGSVTTPAIDHGDGTYTATLTAGTTAGLAIVSGTLNGAAITDTAGVMFRALPDPTTTTITADSAAIDADGASTTLITVRVLDGNGNPRGVSAGHVTLATTLGSVTTPATDHGDGTYTATLTAGTTAGLAIVSGTLNGAAITDTAGVIFRALPDPTTTTITADSAAIDADGASTTLITVRVLDGNSVPVGASAGPVMLATTLGSVTTPATDHGDGTYTATLTAGTAGGAAIITGTLAGAPIVHADTVELRPVGSATATTITADSTSIVADGMATTTVTVRVLDANGHPVGRSAGNVTLTTSVGILSGITDHQDGTYTATLRADPPTEPPDGDGTTAALVIPVAPDTAIITGTLNGVIIADSALVELRAPEREEEDFSIGVVLLEGDVRRVGGTAHDMAVNQLQVALRRSLALPRHLHERQPMSGVESQLRREHGVAVTVDVAYDAAADHLVTVNDLALPRSC